MAETNKRLLALGLKPDVVRLAHVAAMQSVRMRNEIERDVLVCSKCSLSETCNAPVPGFGSFSSGIMFVGEAPGVDEDKKGVPFVGDTGQLLTLMLNKLEVERKDIYITNAVKCRPEKNRTPTKEEIKKCQRHLLSEIQWIKPKVIVTLGNPAMHSVMNDYDLKITRERGRWRKIEDFAWPIYVIHTFHPSYVIRQKGEDFKTAFKQMMGDIRKAVTKWRQLSGIMEER